MEDRLPPSVRIPCGFLRERKKPLGRGFCSFVAGYVRVSANTYAYGLRRGFALLVTGVTL